MSTSSVKALSCYGVMGILLALSVTGTLSTFLPGGVASQVAHNSEAYLLALLLGVLLQWVRPASELVARPWVPLVALAAVFLGIGLALDQGRGRIDSSYATLNEAFFAAGVITIYLLLRRPVVLAPYLALGLLVAIVVFNRTDVVTLQAESLVAVMLAPVSLDVADPTLLDREAADRPNARLTWCVVLLVVPLGFALLYRVELGGIAAEIARYGRRPTEAFLGFFFIHVYFSYVLGSAWRRSPGRNSPAAHSHSPLDR